MVRARHQTSAMDAQYLRKLGSQSAHVSEGGISPPTAPLFLKGFYFREDEKPNSIKDLFIDDPQLILKKIKSLEIN